MTFHFNSPLFRLPFLRDYCAITLPWAIYFAGSHDETDPTTIRHELVHVRQRAKLGHARFYIDYFCQYLRGRWAGMSHDAAYMAISYEREAYREEEADLAPSA